MTFLAHGPSLVYGIVATFLAMVGGALLGLCFGAKPMRRQVDPRWLIVGAINFALFPCYADALQTLFDPGLDDHFPTVMGLLVSFLIAEACILWLWRRFRQR